MFIHQLATALFGLLFPKAPVWVVTLFVELLDAIVDFVGDLDDYQGMEGAEKMAYLVDVVGEYADDAFDDLPQWGELDEAAQDRIISGLGELALFVYRAVEDGASKRDIRRAARKARAKLVLPS